MEGRTYTDFSRFGILETVLGAPTPLPQNQKSGPGLIPATHGLLCNLASYISNFLRFAGLMDFALRVLPRRRSKFSKSFASVQVMFSLTNVKIYSTFPCQPNIIIRRRLFH